MSEASVHGARQFLRSSMSFFIQSEKHCPLSYFINLCWPRTHTVSNAGSVLWQSSCLYLPSIVVVGRICYTRFSNFFFFENTIPYYRYFAKLKRASKESKVKNFLLYYFIVLFFS